MIGGKYNDSKTTIRKIRGCEKSGYRIFAGCQSDDVLGARGDNLGPFQGVSAVANDVAIFIVDTRDRHAWRLGRTDFFDFGTPENPISERTSTNPILNQIKFEFFSGSQLFDRASFSL